MCSPLQSHQSLHSSLFPLRSIQSDSQSNDKVGQLEYHADVSRPLNGLGIQFANTTSVSTLDSFQKDEPISPGVLFQDLGSDIFTGAGGRPFDSPPFLAHYEHTSIETDLPASLSSSTLDSQISWSERTSNGSIDADWRSSPDVTTISQNLKKRSCSPPIYGLFQDLAPFTPPMFPPFADINMFELAFSKQEPSTGVDPANISVSYSEPEDWLSGYPDSPLTPSLSSLREYTPAQTPPEDELSAEVLDEIVTILSSSVVKEPVSIKAENPSIEDNYNCFTALDASAYPMDDPELVYPTSSNFCFEANDPSPFPSPCKKRARKNPRKEPFKKPESTVPEPILGTPVLDAHRGIPLADVLNKAEKYRQRNPGQDIDKRWLHSFAGKLSARGELLQDFRCYVIGCFQTNKRRDHILIHVGSHVDQRPFSCSYCSMRFLRKNELKRHEASHSGERPHVCHICTFEKSFVRLDLLRRHLKRTHGFDLSSDKENRSSFKRLKLEY